MATDSVVLNEDSVYSDLKSESRDLNTCNKQILDKYHDTNTDNYDN